MNDEIGLGEQMVDFLEAHKGEVFSAAELSVYFDTINKLVVDNLTRLMKSHEVDFERVSGKVARKIYQNNNIKRSMNLYFLD